MSITNVRKTLPVFTTMGDYAAFLVYPYIFNLENGWIGFVSPDQDVYNIDGEYVGYMTDDPRILRKRSQASAKPNFPVPPPPPSKLKGPSSIGISPMMSDLGLDIDDVLQDEPERLYTRDMKGIR